MKPIAHFTLPRVLVATWFTAAAFAGNPLPPEPKPPAIEPSLPLAVAEVTALDGPALTDVPPAPQPKRSQNVTINLINRMVKKGLLEQAEADELIAQAEEDAVIARQEAAAVAVQAVAEVQAAMPPPPSDDTVRVTYIPETVKAQIREQIKAEIMNKARDENWAAPRTFPTWASKMRFNGDVRIRGDGVYFPSTKIDANGDLVAGNDNTGSFPNFNSINTGAPFDVTGTVVSPQLNVDKDRQRMRLRARFGIEADLGDGFSAGMRFATGESNTPTSTNQSLGVANNGQGGNFSKYALWLDRGFLKYEVGGQPGKNLAVVAGRFDNPFFTTSEIVWDDDVGMDGIVAQARYEVLKGFTPFIAGGAFPFFNTDLNFSTNRSAKFASTDKWLYGGQLGASWKIAKPVSLKFAAAYFNFDGAEGRLSDPFVPLTTSDQGNTDGTRPAFAQKGNTYRALRNITPTAENDFGRSKQFQYFGLATPFRVLNLNAKLDLNYFEPVQISFFGDYARNLAFESGAIDAIAVNNRGPDGTGGVGAFEGGDTAWFTGVRVGSVALEKRWDWNLGLSYRHVESDAVIDGFVDSDFGVGGTNMEGYTISGNVALSPAVSLGLRWMSANELAGPPLKSDVILIDVNGKF